jgi:hypothetical protein
MFKEPSVQTFDICRYSDGSEYIVTDHGPNVWTTCGRCGGEAAALPTMSAKQVLCGPCMLRQHELWPGQRLYEAKVRYANELGVRTKGRKDHG